MRESMHVDILRNFRANVVNAFARFRLTCTVKVEFVDGCNYFERFLCVNLYAEVVEAFPKQHHLFPLSVALMQAYLRSHERW